MIEGERYMREHNIDPDAPITVSEPTITVEGLNPSLEGENYPPTSIQIRKRPLLRSFLSFELGNLYISYRRGETAVIITDGIAGFVAPIFADFQGQGLLMAVALTDDVVVALAHLCVTGG